MGVTALAFAAQGRMLLKHEPEVFRQQTSSAFFVSDALVGAFLGLALFSVAFVQIQTVFGGADGSLWMPAVWSAVEPSFIGIHAALFAFIALAHTVAARKLN